MAKEKVLLMYSGGLDSILSMAKLVENDYKVLLIHFDNGCSISNGFETTRAKSFEKMYGKDSVEYIGKITTIPEFRNNERQIANTKLSDLQQEFGDCTISQLRCLNCRSAMYYEALKYCIKNNIPYIAEGARKSQLFSIEQPPLISAYKELLEIYGIQLLLPVYDLEDDYHKENELLRHGILPVASEDKCILGMPLQEPASEDTTKAILNVFKTNIYPRYIKALSTRPLPHQEISRQTKRINFD